MPLPVFHRIFLITLFMKLLITNQSIQPTLLFLLSIPTTQLISPRHRFNLTFLCANPKNSTTWTGTRRYKKAASRERRTTFACPWNVTRLPRSRRAQLTFSPELGTPGQFTGSLIAQTPIFENQFGYGSQPKQPGAPRRQFLLTETKLAPPTVAHTLPAEKSPITPRWEERPT